MGIAGREDGGRTVRQCKQRFRFLDPQFLKITNNLEISETLGVTVNQATSINEKIKASVRNKAINPSGLVESEEEPEQ